MSWQILTLISIIAYALAIIAQRVLMKNDKSEPVTYSVVFQLLTGLIIGLFGFLTTNMHFPNIKPLLFNLILMTCLYGFGNIFIFKALKKVEASEFTILFATRGLFTVFASSLFLNEGLRSTQFIGAFLILTAVIFVTVKSFKFHFSTGELLAIVAAFCVGSAVTNDRFLLGHFDVYPYVTIAFIFPALFIGLLNPQKMKHIDSLLKKTTLIKMSLMCVFYAVSSITFFSALQIGKNSSQIAVLNLLSIILIVIIGTIFLNERKHIYRKIAGAALSIIGGITLIK